MPRVHPRCWSFDPNTGEPLTPRGCPNGNACSFVHPDSPLWKDAPTSSRFAHPRRERSPLASSSRALPHNSELMKSHDSDRSRGWQGSPTRGRRPAPSSDSSTAMRNVSGSKDSSSRAPHSTSTWGKDAAPSSSGWGEHSTGWGESALSATGWGEPSTTTARRGDSPKRPKPTSSTSGWGETSTSPTTRGGSSWGTKEATSSKEGPQRHPPPPSSRPPPLPPVSEPMPVRKPSAQVSEGVTPTAPKTRTALTTNMNTAALRKVYMHRVTQLSQAVQLNLEYTQVVNTLESRRKMLNSQKYSHISENSQSKLDAYAQEYEVKARELKSQLNDIVTKLIESELWPDGPPPEDPSLTHEDGVRQLQDLETRMKSLENMAKAEKSAVDQRPKPPDGAEPSLGTARAQPSTSDSQVDPTFLARLEHLETRFDDIGNEAMQQTENFLQQAESRMEEKLEAIRTEKSIGADVEMRDGEGTGSSAEILEQINKLSTTFDGFVDEMVDVIEKHKDLTLETRRLSQENEALAAKNSELDSKGEVLKAEVARVDNQVQTLISAFKIMKTNPPEPTAAVVLEQMREQIRDDILRDLGPVLEQLRQHCESTLVAGQQQMIEKIGEKLGRTVEMVNIIYDYFEGSIK